MKLVVSSDNYFVVRPEVLPLIEKKLSSMDKHSKYSFPWPALSIDEGVIFGNSTINFTNEQVYNMLSKAVKLSQNTPESTEYLLYKFFDDRKRYAIPPGTLRFYSKDHICFFNGRDWRKFTP